jgi:hypothetical protein
MVAGGVQYGWALQLSLLTPYVQVHLYISTCASTSYIQSAEFMRAPRGHVCPITGVWCSCTPCARHGAFFHTGLSDLAEISDLFFSSHWFCSFSSNFFRCITTHTCG